MEMSKPVIVVVTLLFERLEGGTVCKWRVGGELIDLQAQKNQNQRVVSWTSDAMRNLNTSTTGLEQTCKKVSDTGLLLCCWR